MVENQVIYVMREPMVSAGKDYSHYREYPATLLAKTDKRFKIRINKGNITLVKWVKPESIKWL